MSDAAEAIPEEAGSQEPVHFLDQVDEAIRDNPSLQKFNDINGLAKSYINANQMIGAEKMARPQANWSDDQYNEFYAAAGRPEAASDYELNINQDVFADATLEGFRDSAHAAGLNGAQAQKMVNYLESSVNEMRQNFEAQGDDLRQDSEMELRAEFGKTFDKKIELANKTAKHLLGGTDEALEILEIGLADGRLLGDVPEIVRLFTNLGGEIGEDNLPGEAMAMEPTPKEAKRQINEIMYSGPYNDKMHPEHDALVQEVTRLWEYAS